MALLRRIQVCQRGARDHRPGSLGTPQGQEQEVEILNLVWQLAVEAAR